MVEYVADHVDYHLDVQAFGKAVRAWILCHAISWTRMTNTVKFFMTNFTEEDATIFHINLQQLCLEMDHTLDPMNWDFLRHLQGSRAQEGNIADCHRQCHSWMQKWLHNQTQDVPAQMGRTRIVLHAFSGRRRLGDLQYYLEKDLPAEASFDLVVVSLDIVINAHWGDATREDTRRLWLTAIRDKHVVGFIAGPPCETWSRVRGALHPAQGEEDDRDVQAMGRGLPRVLRTLSELWGLPSLGLRELSQIFDWQ